MSTITVFTPTYNRSATLERTYESLCRQTCRDFEWLIIDDGSTDNTADIVNKWILENKIPIKYIYKENGGLHTGYNTALLNIETELSVCCDSDDFLPDNAIEIILETWTMRKSDRLAGIIGLDFDMSTGQAIGGIFPRTDLTVHVLELQSKLKHHGDTKIVFRTDVVKPYVPMPTFAGEKNFNPIYLFLKIDPSLEYLIINENLCNVDYQQSGMSANILNQFRNSPRSFGELRRALLSHPRVSLKRKFIDAAHLVSSALLAKDISIVLKSPQKVLTALSVPLGVAFYLYIMMKTRNR